MHTIENDQLRVRVKPFGAELFSIFNKTTGLEYLWDGNPDFWSKRSPVLFPIVGTLKDNTYYFGSKAYQLGRHGFAREKMFSLDERSPSSVSLLLADDPGTIDIFPFTFSLKIIYSIEQNRLSVKYEVKNRGEGTMYFSIGGHPAFKVPIVEGVDYEDYYLLFNQQENAPRWPISPNGLIEKLPTKLIDNSDRLQLTKPLFYHDALVLKHLRSNQVQLRSDKHSAGLEFSFEGFPYFGIWAAKDAGFVCLEPWCGIADSVGTNQQLTEKEGIILLPINQQFSRAWHVTTW